MTASPASSQPVLAIDIDDTLVTSEAALRANHNQKFPQISVLSSFYTYDFSHRGDDADGVEAEIQRFFDSDEFYQLLPLEGAVSAVDKLRQKYQLVLVTARPQHTKARTMAWINAHFPGRFSVARFVGTDEHKKINLQRSKLAALKDLGVDILIDDNLHHTREVAANGIRAILFGDYGWNQTQQLPAGISRASSWREVEEQLL